MPALNFAPRFAPLVESGAKLQTIRGERKHPIKAGDTLYLYTGMRTQQCRRLGIAVCTSVQSISIKTGAVTLDGKWRLDSRAMHDLARADGFASLEEFLRFFALVSRPFTGQLIKWDFCRAGRDGSCIYQNCPQARANEPFATGRHCPLDLWTKASL